MAYNVCRISPQHNFVIKGASYIGNPKSNTCMFVTKRVENLIENLKGVSQCLVFAETGMAIPETMKKENCFLFSDNSPREYARFVADFYKTWFETERKRKYKCTPEGYYCGENVVIGEDAYIEPGCVIGHDVTIGSHACIFAGTVIKKAMIGNNFVANEGAVIGTSSFTMAEDENGNKFRIPTLGNVIIGNNVEIGANCNIACGTGGNTVIEDYVKMDGLTYIGHDAYICSNVQLAAGVIIAGFAYVNEHAHMGINASVRNRVTVGENSYIGMGSTVTKNVDPDVVVVGNPAKLFNKS